MRNAACLRVAYKVRVTRRIKAYPLRVVASHGLSQRICVHRGVSWRVKAYLSATQLVTAYPQRVAAYMLCVAAYLRATQRVTAYPPEAPPARASVCMFASI